MLYVKYISIWKIKEGEREKKKSNIQVSWNQARDAHREGGDWTPHPAAPVWDTHLDSDTKQPTHQLSPFYFPSSILCLSF